MSAITALDVTFGESFKSGAFTRKQDRSVNGAGGSGASWLWLGKHTLDAEIVEMRLLSGDEACPTGWEKVRREVSHKTGEDGYTVLEHHTSPVGSPVTVRLAVRHRKAGDWSYQSPGDMLQVGDRCDVRYEGAWFKGHVTMLTGIHVFVKRCGYEMDGEIKLLKQSDGLAAFGTHTECGTSESRRMNPALVGPGETFEINAETLVAMQTEIDAIIRGTMTLEAAYDVVEQHLAPCLEQALSADIADAEDESIYTFTQSVLRLCVYFMCRPEPLHPAVRQQLVRVFLGDQKCSLYFRRRRNGIFGTAPGADRFIGETARFPASGACKYFVGNVNYFAKIGGYEVLARRLDSCGSFQVPIKELKEIVQHVIKTPFRMFTERFARDMFPRLYIAVLNRLLRMSSNELQVYPRDVTSKEVQQIMTNVYEAIQLPPARVPGNPGFHGYGEVLPIPYDEMMETWDARMSLRQLRAEPRSIRIQGMMYLVDMVQQTRRREGRLVNFVLVDNQPVRLPESKYWTGSTLAQWIKEAGVVQALLGAAEDGDLSGVVRRRATPDADEPDRPLRACVTLVDPKAAKFMAGEEEAARAASEHRTFEEDGPASGAGAGWPDVSVHQAVSGPATAQPQCFAAGGRPGRFNSTYAGVLAHMPEVLTLLTEEKQLGPDPNAADDALSRAFQSVWRSGEVGPKVPYGGHAPMQEKPDAGQLAPVNHLGRSATDQGSTTAVVDEADTDDDDDRRPARLGIMICGASESSSSEWILWSDGTTFLHDISEKGLVTAVPPRLRPMLQWRRAVEAKRDAGMVFQAASEGRPLELGKRVRLGKLAGGLTSMGAIEVLPGSKVARAVELMTGGRAADQAAQLTTLRCTPLVAAMLHEHHECVKVLAKVLRSSWVSEQQLAARAGPSSGGPPIASAAGEAAGPPAGGSAEDPTAGAGLGRGRVAAASGAGWIAEHSELIKIIGHPETRVEVSILDLVRLLSEAGMDSVTLQGALDGNKRDD